MSATTPNEKQQANRKENNSGSKSKKIKLKGDKEVEVPILETGDAYLIQSDFEGLRLIIDCPVRTMGMICDLDINLYCYDERARFVERIDLANKESKDKSILIAKDIDTWDLKRFSLKILFNLVKPSVTAILVYLDGGPKNFQFIQSLKVTYIRVLKDKGYGDWLQDEEEASGKNAPFLNIFGRTRKNFQGFALCAIYKEGWGEDESSCVWATKSFLEPVYTTAKKEKEDILSQLVIGAVPVLDKYRPRLFSNIRDICTALSSNSLPKLKKKFQKTVEGLNITDFIDVLFKQLYETHPKIIEESEAAYAVAMLQEMFHQIDYNGDQNTNWDEFTTFCVQTGVGPAKADTIGSFSLQQYVIEYKEQIIDRDKILSAYRANALMRYIPETRKILIIPESSDNIQVLDEQFHLLSTLKPTRIQVTGSVPSKEETVKTTSIVYDIIFLQKRDFFAFCSSDHSITITKEMSSMGGRKITYVQHNRFFHTLLHFKLCWSPKHEVLCSAASDRGIYGWNIDNGQNLFQITRHSDNITDFICLDHLNVFITCGMDRKIVMWSATSRRVKGIFIGHARGVRCLSCYESVLLSAGFECEAKIWDLVSKDNVSILRGHRHPIAAAKLMCERSLSEKEQRAITVDELGIFMLWNIYVQERGSDAAIISPLQVFEMHNPETPINQVRFLAVPFSSASSSTYYSDIIACSTKLMHFVAEKNIQEFIAPSSSVFNEAASSILTAVGKNILTYDIALGYFSNVFENVTGQEVCSLCMDGERGRRMFIGTNSGELLLLNSMSGTILDRTQYHTREITSIKQWVDSRSNIFTCSMDGSLRLFEECNGKLHIHTSIENAFAEGMGIITMKLAPSVNTVVAVSAGKYWGLWNSNTLKKIIIFDQGDVITAVEIIGASNDSKDPDIVTLTNPNKKSTKTIENLLTLALATIGGIYVYTLDTEDIRGIKTFQLVDTRQLYIVDMSLLKAPEHNSLNYTFKKGQEDIQNEVFLIAGTDDGTVATWKTTEIRRSSEEKFRKRFENVRVNREINSPNGNSRPGTNNSSRPKTNESTASAKDKVNSKKSKNMKESNFLKSNLFLTGFEDDQQTQAVKNVINCEGVSIDDFFQMAIGEKDINYIRAERHWLTHKDSLIMVVPLSAHGCFYTGSHDGYHRIWNLDEDYLGELKLPNITEKMKGNSMDTDFGTNWKFILERIPITPYHDKLAAALVKNLQLSRKEKLQLQQNFNNERRMATSQGMMKGFLFDEISEDEQAQHRKTIMKNLFEVSKPPEDHPPSRLPTKEEKELLKLSLTMEIMNVSKSMNNLNKANSAPGELESFSVDNKSATGKLNKSTSIKALTKSALATKSASILEQENNVCMSCLGLPSLWSVPGEKDIFGNKIITGKNTVPDKLIPPSFSEASVNAMRFEGIIDVESQMILRKVAKNADNVSVYERSQPILLIRNPSMSTSVQLPSIESIKKTEITFGVQKDMYKNAEKVINERENVSKQLVRNSVALARIDANVRKIGTMIHLIQPPSHDDVILPKNVGENEDDINNMRSEGQKMKIRLLKSASQVPIEAAMNARPLDRSSIENWMNKVNIAVDFGVDKRDKDKKKQKKREIISVAAVHTLESKLRHAIRAEFKHRLAKLNQKNRSEVVEDGPTPDAPEEKVILTTRHLLPYYKLENVIQFMDIFAKVDENFSGDLDVNEWIKLFGSLNEESVSSVEARMIFMKLDQDSDGFLTMKELIPVVFSKANREQQHLIIKFAQSHLAKNLEADNVFKVTTVELDQLFEAYDTECVGFIDVSLIKDRIKAMNLSEQTLFFIMSSMSDMADDEMVSLVEYKRLFKIFSRKM